MKNQQCPQKKRTIVLTSPRSRLAPLGPRRLHKVSHGLPRFFAWLTNLPHFSLLYLTLIGAGTIFLRMAFDTDPLSGVAVAAIGGLSSFWPLPHPAPAGVPHRFSVFNHPRGLPISCQPSRLGLPDPDPTNPKAKIPLNRYLPFACAWKTAIPAMTKPAPDRFVFFSAKRPACGRGSE